MKQFIIILDETRPFGPFQSEQAAKDWLMVNNPEADLDMVDIHEMFAPDRRYPATTPQFMCISADTLCYGPFPSEQLAKVWAETVVELYHPDDPR